MLETDNSETANEMIMSCRKMGSCGLIAAYAGFTNHFNIGMLLPGLQRREEAGG